MALKPPGSLLQSLQVLHDKLKKLNNVGLLVIRGDPAVIVPQVCKKWSITHLAFEIDRNGYARERDAKLVALESPTLKVLTTLGHSLYDPLDIIKANHNKSTNTLAAWQKAAASLPEVQRPIPAPTSLPPVGERKLRLQSNGVEQKSDIDLNANTRTKAVTCYDEEYDETFSIPTMESLGLPEATTSIQGGEDEALRRLDAYCEDKEQVWRFKKPETSPAQFDPPATTQLSPYLHFGCLSIREFYWRVKDIIDELNSRTSVAAKDKSKPPENLVGQIEFREMYYTAEAHYGDSFQRIRGNSLTHFINWDLRNQYDEQGNEILPRPPGDPVAEERFLRWTEGRTGFPWIDALMRQLKQEGWIHHLGRHSVACFLTRGQCYISWERGKEVFDELLVDWDPASNAGNWMWLSCSAFFHQYYRVYSPVAFPTKWDKTGGLVRKYCPELAKFPDKYIYQPHLASIEIQKKAGCIVGKDYPAPMLDDKLEKERCLIRLKASYDAGFTGDSKEAKDGSADMLLQTKTESALSALSQSEKSVQSKSGDVKRKASTGNQDIRKAMKR